MKALAEEAQSATATARLRKYMVSCFLPLEGEKIMTIPAKREAVRGGPSESRCLSLACVFLAAWCDDGDFPEGVESSESRTRTNTGPSILPGPQSSPHTV